VTTPKKVVSGLLGHGSQLSVRRGHGTSRNWIYITTLYKVPWDVREIVEDKLIELKMVGTYPCDMADTREANVLWEVRKK